ncbi:septum formation initiator family protein [Patescibacteria group bacterium]
MPELIFSKFFLVFCVFLFLVILFGLAKGTIKNYKVDSEIGNLQDEINNLERQNQDLGQLIGYLKSDDFVEQEAKLKFGYKKTGETLVVIPNQEIEEFKTEDINISNELANPIKWWAYFFN